MAKVIIAEKPSVAKNIAQALGASNRRDGYFEGKHVFITWAFGHLLELYDAKDYEAHLAQWRMDNFPFIPETFRYKVKSDQQDRGKPDAGAYKQLEQIRTLIDLEAVDGVILATDYDREGQIIGDIILEYIGVQKPVKRLLLNEWTPKEVTEGLKRLVDNHTMSPLRDAGISRQWADWVIGINLTSVASLKYNRERGKTLNVGRVLMPTLKIIYDRDLEIENFVPESYHRLLTQHKSASGKPFDAVVMLAEQERFEDLAWLEGAKKAIEADKAKGAEVVSVQKEHKREYPPSLFNLSGLQGHVTSKHKGWNSERVLKVAQGLYEKQLITYPRTASLALEESLIDKARRVLEVHKQGLPYAEQLKFHTQKRVFDQSKVESHSAIMPTYIVPKRLTPEEQVVYDAVRNRFLMQFMPLAEHEETRVTLRFPQLSDTPYDELRGVSKGRVQLVEGWRLIEAIKTKEKTLPELIEGELTAIAKITLETKGTKPPKHHTEKTLLRVMETCGKRSKSKAAGAMSGGGSDGAEGGDGEDEGDGDGEDGEAVAVQGIGEDHQETAEERQEIEAILSGYSIGTPATRAETIAKLIRVGYVSTKGKSLICTPVGRRMVEQFPVKDLFDLAYTGRLEKILSDISKGELEMTDFLSRIYSFTAEAVAAVKADTFKTISGEAKAQDKSNTSEQGKTTSEALGLCPGCGAPVYDYEKSYGCSNYRSGCRFAIWKNDKFLEALKVKASEGVVRKLLAQGRVCSHSFVNKKGETFSACLSYKQKPDSPYYQWEFVSLE